FAATHPERVSALVLMHTAAVHVQDDDYPWGVAPDDVDAFLGMVKDTWGTGASVKLMAPSRAGDERFRAWWARCERLSAGPDEMAETFRAAYESDLRPTLASVMVPTLVLHRERNRFVHLDEGRYLADHIPGAKLVVLPGKDHLFFVGDTDALVDEIEEFLTGGRSGAEGDVVTATILFTDIVGSTEHQALIGQREWSRLTDQHDAMIRAALTRHRGHEIKTTGDGFLATFDAAASALRCAAEILAAAEAIRLKLRAGGHTAEVEVRGDDRVGRAVSIVRRIPDLAAPGQVLVSETVRSVLVGSSVEFEDRGEHELKGVPGIWRLYSIASK